LGSEGWFAACTVFEVCSFPLGPEDGFLGGLMAVSASEVKNFTYD